MMEMYIWCKCCTHLCKNGRSFE